LGLDNEGKTIIHNLLLRSLFLLYLEDRGATTEAFYKKIDTHASSYFQILDSKENTYKLFSILENHFNGNLNPVTKEELKLVTKEHLNIIKQCFWSEIDTSNQGKLFNWRIFDFNIISIELVSEIYENFLTTQSEDGAYYTPNILVDCILNKVLPFPSTNDCVYDKKILDPTCGSGIFLVQSLNRLLDRWEFAHPDKQLDFETIQKITVDNIFGIEYNPEAIKVAAFSIYLTMLNRLNPKELWEQKKSPYLIYAPENPNKNTQGQNLFCMSSLGKGPFDSIEFDLVVGNPPFKRGNLSQEAKAYLQNKKNAQEYILAFLDKAIQLSPNGDIALIASSKILFNATKGYQRFRKFLFVDSYVK
jgi:type I restriction-modification system DNA methylase subunit